MNDGASHGRLTRRALIGGLLALPPASTLPSASGEGDEPTANPLPEPSPIHFRKRTINASSDFESACAVNIDGVGRLDIVCGDTWCTIAGGYKKGVATVF